MINRSFKNQSASKMIVMVVVNTNKDACIGLVSDMPLVENVWFLVIPARVQKR